MPQFQLDNFLPQLVWLALFFMILYFGVVKLTLPKIGKVMDEREQTVDADLSAAEAARADADSVRSGYEQAIAEAHAKAQGQIAQAKSSAGVSIEQKLAKVGVELDEKLAAAQVSITASRAAAMGEVDRIAADAVSQIVERLTGDAPAEAEIAAAITAGRAG